MHGDFDLNGCPRCGYIVCACLYPPRPFTGKPWVEIPKPANDNYIIEIRPATKEDIVMQQKHSNDNFKKKHEKAG